MIVCIDKHINMVTHIIKRVDMASRIDKHNIDMAARIGKHIDMTTLIDKRIDMVAHIAKNILT